MKKIIKEIQRRYDWKGYLIACIIISLGSFLIHAQQNQPPQIDIFFMWLPVVWFLTLILMFYSLFSMFSTIIIPQKNKNTGLW